jgi:hypothetical protein
VAQDTVRVKGLKELQRTLRDADKNLRASVRKELREAGEIVRSEAATLFSPRDARSAAGYKVRVRQRGVAVEQSLRKTTGLHPEYGSLQMRDALLPALDAKEGEVVSHLEGMLDRLADDFN